MLSELDLQLQMDKHNELCSFDVEYLEEPVKPVIHNIPKLLFFVEGTGKIRIYNKEFDIVPNTLLIIFPWEIVEITQVEKPLAIMKISYNSVFNSLVNTAGFYDPLLILLESAVEQGFMPQEIGRAHV